MPERPVLTSVSFDATVTATERVEDSPDVLFRLSSDYGVYAIQTRAAGLIQLLKTGRRYHVQVTEIPEE